MAIHPNTALEAVCDHAEEARAPEREEMMALFAVAPLVGM
jgi:hypothetical protein